MNIFSECRDCGGLLTGSDDEAVIQALRNLWLILSSNGRRQAVDTVNSLKGNE